MVVKSHLIITCGPSALPELFDGSVEFISGDYLRTDGPSLVQVTDFYGQTTYLPLKLCSTYVALRRNIESKCLDDSEEDGEDYVIHVGSDDSVLEADQWPHIMKSERSAMIVLRLSRKSTSRDISLIDRSRSEQGKIEYGDLSSEHDSTDEDKTKALILRRPFNDVEPIYHSKYVGATSELLARQGYVVNDPYSLVSGSNPITSPKPIIFRRPERMVRPPFVQDGLHVARAITYESDNSGHISSGSYASVVDTKELAGEALSFAERVSSTSLVDDPVESAHSSRESHVPEHIDIEDDEKLSGSFELTPDVYDTRKYTEKDVQGPLSSSSRSINERDRPESEDEEATLGAIRNAISDCEEGVGFGVKAKARFSQSQPNLHVATQDAPGLFKGDVKGEELVDSDLPPQDDANITQEEKRRLGVEDSPGDLRGLVGLQVRDLKGLISEEVAAALRQNTDQVNRDVQKQLEFELRNRLAKSGLLPNLIEAIINQGTDTAPGREERSLPNYTRHDILDPNFWIIFQHLTTEELLPMFDHTCDRRIEAHLERKRQEGSRAQTQERQEQNPPMDASPSEHDDRASREKTMDRNRAATTYRTREVSPSPKLTRLNTGLRVPPFLAWQTEEDPSEHNTDESTHIQLTLFAIEQQLTRTRTDVARLPIDLTHPFAHKYQLGVRLTNKESSLDAVLTSLAACYRACARVVGNTTKPNELTVMDDTNGLSNPLESGTGITNSDIAADVRTDSEAETYVTTRRVTQWQMALMHKHAQRVFHSTMEIVDQFVPKHYDHQLLRRCWGALKFIIEVMTPLNAPKGCFGLLLTRPWQIVGYMGVKNVVYQELEESEPSSTYAIRELPHKEYLRLHKLTDLSFPVNQCDFCKRARYYSSAEEAFEHLRRDHVSDTNQSSHLSRAQLSHWVMSSQLAGVEEQNELIVEYLSAMALRVETLRSKAIDIRNSVANERNEKPSEYLLPLSLVKAAEMILQMIDTCGYSVVELHKLNLDDTMPIISWKELKTHMDLLSYFGSAASTTLSSARKELLIMAHTGSHRGAVQNFRSTPEVTLLICLIHLWSRAVLHDLSVPDLYREHLSKMQYEASRRPSKLALRELYLLEEEFEMVASICAQQRRMIRDFYEIIGPSTYRIATKECFRADRDIVIPLMDQNLSSPASMGATSIGVRETQALFDRTKEVLRHNVEVSEESNSKAIRVFTLVTIVFLPLSFISSVFGMNTTDIRDMSSSQALFWVIAIPATTLIGGLSLMIAYHGTYMWAKVRAMGDAMWGSEKISRGRRAWKRKPKDVEKVDDGEIADTRPLGPGHLRRRKTVLNVVGSKKPRKFR
ncbi:uncharacterized protein J4E84_005335 [Alternaria hordeiaustralica]|uniref:uncharacterized protein n=1 Tax=Alternaria hordeiaustralica TaxID=1187925 RepID=UPI0020C216EE|nr:uncharacterized protein J4E84_005335 [Alternaria hordeiaustralica]KAI4686964.1 hypothetical protein J4E84_005335 [Alternaria hordeiaustralica]